MSYPQAQAGVVTFSVFDSGATFPVSFDLDARRGYWVLLLLWKLGEESGFLQDSEQ